MSEFSGETIQFYDMIKENKTSLRKCEDCYPKLQTYCTGIYIWGKPGLGSDMIIFVQHFII